MAALVPATTSWTRTAAAWRSRITAAPRARTAAAPPSLVRAHRRSAPRATSARRWEATRSPARCWRRDRRVPDRQRTVRRSRPPLVRRRCSSRLRPLFRRAATLESASSRPDQHRTETARRRRTACQIQAPWRPKCEECLRSSVAEELDAAEKARSSSRPLPARSASASRARISPVEGGRLG